MILFQNTHTLQLYVDFNPREPEDVNVITRQYIETAEDVADEKKFAHHVDMLLQARQVFKEVVRDDTLAEACLALARLPSLETIAEMKAHMVELENCLLELACSVPDFMRCVRGVSPTPPSTHLAIFEWTFNRQTQIKSRYMTRRAMLRQGSVSKSPDRVMVRSDGAEYPSGSSAARALGVPAQLIYKHISNGYPKEIGGFTFKWRDL